MRRKNRSASWFALAVWLGMSQFAWSQSGDLADLLDKTTRQTSAYLDHLSDVRCTERVVQQKLTDRGHVEYARASTYDYFVLLQADANDFMLSESRMLQKDNNKAMSNVPLLLTNGFSTLFLVFHPYYRDSFRFELVPPEKLNGHSFRRIRFSHIPGTRTPAAIAVRGREFPLELTGTAWIDADSGAIARMEIALENDMRDVGLRSLSAQMDFSEVRLPGWSDTYRFPDVATVDVETLHQHWRNLHTFTKYQRFVVDTSASVPEEVER